MEPRTMSSEAKESGTIDLAAALLVVQAAFGMVSAVGLVVFAAIFGASPLMAGALLVAVGAPALAIVLARGITRLRRWARSGALVYEVLVLLGAIFRLVVDGTVALGLVVTLTSMVMPTAVVLLVLSPSARGAIAGARRRTSAPIEIEVADPLMLRPAA